MSLAEVPRDAEGTLDRHECPSSNLDRGSRLIRADLRHDFLPLCMPLTRNASPFSLISTSEASEG